MSFMKRVAKLALPIAASLIPGIGPLMGMGTKLAMGIGGAAGAASGLLGGGSNKNSGGSSNALALQQNKLLGDTITKSQTMSQGTIDMGKPLVDQGSGFMKQSGDYFSSMLQGGSAQSKALAGPIADLKTGSQAQLRNLSMGPRGNIAGLMGDQSAQLGSQIARLRYGSQGEAAQGLQGAGNSLLGSGSNLVTQGNNSFQDALRTLLGKYGVDSATSTADANRKSASQTGLGEGIGSILGMLLQPGGLLNKSKTGTGTKSPLVLPTAPWNPNGRTF